MKKTATEFELECAVLTAEIKAAYEQGVTMEQAERLAGRFLHAMILVSEELKTADLDSRMRKTGVKAIKAAVYLKEATKGDKKPSDVLLGALVDSNDAVRQEQDAFDEAEVKRDNLHNYYNIFKESHVYARGIAKGRFE